MKFYITNFAHLRYLTESFIPISTCANDPFFFHVEDKSKYKFNNEGYYVNKNNVLFGIREESLSPLNLKEEDITCINCDHSAAPNCRFMSAYRNYILSIDFKAMINELQRVAEDVRKITKFSGEPNIILLVYEAVSSPCSERYGLKELFKNNDIELIEFDKNLLA